MNFAATPAEYYERANDEILVVLQTESPTGVANAEEIYSLPGCDAIFIGPADLAASLGYPGQSRHPHVREMVLGAIERGAIYVDCPQRITKGSSTLWLLPDTLLNLNVTQTLDNLKEEVEQETDSMLIGIEESYVSLPFTNYRMNVMSKSAALISSMSSLST